MFDCFDFEQKANPPLISPIPPNLPKRGNWGGGCAYLPAVELPESVPDIGHFLRRYPRPAGQLPPGRTKHYVGPAKGAKGQ